MLYKICTKCKIEKSLSDFGKDKNRKDNLNLHCKECCKIYRDNNKEKHMNTQRDWTLKGKYNLTLEDYNKMLEAQNGVCAICGQKETRKIRSNNSHNLVVDHNHKTNKVRGLLCSKCNSGIGMLNDSIELLIKAVEYLKKN